MENKNINMIDNLVDGYKVPFKRSKDIAWQNLESSINFEESAPKRKTIWLNVAIGSVAAAAAILIFFFSNLFNLNVIENSVSTSFAEVNPVYLPDSSCIILNSNSTLDYKFENISGIRSVSLNGDALFNVKKGKLFTVNFNGGEVKVTGTSFYVSAYSKDMLQVDCTEGSVEVTLGDDLVKLSAGQGVKSYNGKVSGTYECSPTEVNERLSGVFNWNKVNLSEPVEFLGYRFGYETVIDESLAQRSFSGKVDLNNLNEGLLIISLAMDINYSVDENQKTIYINAN
jgi:ferric-dicitrate binding protein FerR (iron transport regulator)